MGAQRSTKLFSSDWEDEDLAELEGINIPESDSNRSFQNENSNVNPDAVSKCSFPMENSNKDNKNNEVATTFSEKAKVDISSWNCEICDYRCKNETSLNAHMSRKHPTIQQLDGNSSLGATSIEKIPKVSASGRNFLNPLPPPSSGRPKCLSVLSYILTFI